MVKTQLFSKFRHHKIPKVATVISDDSLGNTKMSYDMIKKEQCHGLSSVFKCWHRLGPFRKVIDDYNNVSMPPGQVRVTCHEIDAPFHKGTNGDDRVKRSEMRPYLVIIGLASMAFLNDDYAVVK